MEKLVRNNGLILSFVIIFTIILTFGCSLSKKSDNDKKTNPNASKYRPVINSLDKYEARPGDNLIVEGDYFGIKRDTSYVKFNTTKAIKYSDWQKKKINLLVPANAESGHLVVVTSGGTSDPVNFRVLYPPAIESFSPYRARYAYDTVIINGKYFGTTSLHLDGKVKIGQTSLSSVEINSISINNWSDTQIKFIVPAGVPSGHIYLATKIGMDSTQDNIRIVKEPVIANVNINPVFVGQLLNIYGTDFIAPSTGSSDPPSINEKVTITDTIGTINTIPTVYWSDDEIRVFIGDTDKFKSGKLAVNTYIGKSNEIDLKIMKNISGWNKENIDNSYYTNDTTNYTTAIYDSSNNKLHIAYTVTESTGINYLKYATSNLNSNIWNIQKLDSTVIAPNMVINNIGLPRMLYYTERNTIKFADLSSSGIWETTTIDGTTNTKKLTNPSTAIEIDPRGIVYLAYNLRDIVSSRQLIKFAKIDTTGIVTKKQLFSDTTICTQIALCLNKDNLPFIGSNIGYDILYVFNKLNRIKYFESTITGWNTTEVKKGYGNLDYLDSSATFGGIDLKRDNNGIIHMALVDGTTKFIDDWPVDGGVFYSSSKNGLDKLSSIYTANNYFNKWNNFVSMAIEKNVPHFIYTAIIDNRYNLYYTKYDSTNVIWSQSDLIAAKVDISQSRFLFDKNGKIHIFYFDSGLLKHINRYESTITKY
ncbi:MAG: IPT/TIG domain-containing protein [Candidatus Firestonebacteria bacterium]|nr:IPT/TIG domain-containing protein [Candidatus Firestonebacteria bacterium]